MVITEIGMRIIEVVKLALPALIVILNPVMAATTLSSITEGMPNESRIGVAKKACQTSFWVLVVFAICGGFIFQMFSITIGAFQIAGGIILFDAGMEIRREKHNHEGVSVREDLSIVPLAIPLISGPGAITTILILAGETKHIWEIAILILCCLIAIGLVYLVMRYSNHVFKLLGPGGVRILNRLMGLIIAVIAVQFVVNGIQSLLPSIMTMLELK